MACAEYAVKPNFSEYLQGYDKGIREFCQPDKGYHRGLNGFVNNHVCTAPLRQAYNTAYKKGKQIYHLERRITNVRNEIDDNIERKHNLEHKRYHLEKRLINESLAKNVRAKLVYRIHKLGDRILHTVDYLNVSERRLSDLIHEAKELKLYNNPCE